MKSIVTSSSIQEIIFKTDKHIYAKIILIAENLSNVSIMINISKQSERANLSNSLKSIEQFILPPNSSCIKEVASQENIQSDLKIVRCYKHKSIKEIKGKFKYKLISLNSDGIVIETLKDTELDITSLNDPALFV